ncbi:MAG: hypothetical protein ACOYLP_03505 [Flavobacterium sp.]
MTSIWLLQIYIKNFSNSVPKKNIPKNSGYFNIFNQIYYNPVVQPIAHDGMADPFPLAVVVSVITANSSALSSDKANYHYLNLYLLTLL